ncbi:MAG: glycosyltransferase [Solirubrobacterales bacterium]|nr:glycosyltransferase [Solirubrobacterales bacterium]
MTRFSIVIPTYQRRQIVVRMVRALERQELDDFEVVVAVDGSTDGTAAALRDLSLSFPLKVVEQDNLGAGAARNAGAAAAEGEILLFIDDDMEADPRLLLEHERSHREGAAVVLGDLPLHPDSPRTLISWGVGLWASDRRRRLLATGGNIGMSDLLTGQISVGRSTYEEMGGFDTEITREGLFGGEDTDFGYRVARDGLRMVYNPKAITYQYYDVEPALYLKRVREAARSGQELALMHPEQRSRIDWGPVFKRRLDRWLFGPLVHAPEALVRPVRGLAVLLARTGRTGRRVREFYFAVRTVEHLRAVRFTRLAISGEAVVLAYHAIADLRGDRLLAPYGVPAPLFGRQLDALLAAGWSFVDLEAVVAALGGERPLPEKAVLLTFDDAYEDLRDAALPELERRGIPAVAFAVADRVGDTNSWDEAIGGASIGLLDAEGLREIAARGVEVGSHGMTHTSLAGLGAERLEQEVAGSARRLESMGLPRPRSFSFPYGESDPEAEAAVEAAGCRVSFTVTPGLVGFGSDRHALPRIQIGAADTPRRLLLKVRTAGWSPRWRARLLRWTRVER